jgi:hypothetical protein
MRIWLKGINSVKKKLADGSVKIFYYAWKSGPALLGEPGSPEFIASYNEAVARKVMPPSGTLLSLLQQYQASLEFVDLARSTRRSYIALIKRIEKKFSDSRCRRLRIGGHAEFSRIGAIRSPQLQVGDRATTPGPCSRVSYRGAWIAELLTQTLASAAVGSIVRHATIKSGRTTMRRAFSTTLRRTCI